MKFRKATAFAVSCFMASTVIPYASYAETELSMNDICTVTADGNNQYNLATAYSTSLYYHGTMNSYLIGNSDGTFTRISYEDGFLYRDRFDSDFSFIARSEMDMELPEWGCFYSGGEYNYFLFGQSNPSELDSVEVMRVVKYSKEWKRLDSTSFYGCNTSIPNSAATPRMHEKNGMLYIQTAHTMYKSDDDGLNHQANFQIHIDVETMECVHEFSDVSWINDGYVSHSFDQYVRVDDSYVYTVDLGDAYPRSAVICKKSPNGDFVGYNESFPIYGYAGNNYTGVTLGGFELSDESCLLLGNSVGQNKDEFTSDVRNIFLTVTDKDMGGSETIWLTDFDTDYRVTAPKLVKIDDNSFIAMWNEYEEHESTDYASLLKMDNAKCRIVKLDAEGNILESITNKALVTDCDPIIVGDELVWFEVDYSGSTSFYHLEYDNLSQYDGLEYEILGDADLDGAVNASDASLVLTDYAFVSTGGESLLTGTQRKRSDVNSDGYIDSSDASTILAYYAYISTGGTGYLEDYI